MPIILDNKIIGGMECLVALVCKTGLQPRLVWILRNKGSRKRTPRTLRGVQSFDIS
jgi:hypothetical protein